MDKKQLPKPAPNPVVKDKQVKPCGCVFTDYSDGTGSVNPCVPHGLVEAGRALNAAAQALSAIGQRILNTQAQAQFAEAMGKIKDPKQ